MEREWRNVSIIIIIMNMFPNDYNFDFDTIIVLGWNWVRIMGLWHFVSLYFFSHLLVNDLLFIFIN